jgi:hypothetical protein
MRPRVDDHRFVAPAAPHPAPSTRENNTARLTARPLIKENTMRRTTRNTPTRNRPTRTSSTLVALLLLGASCVGSVGEDAGTPNREKDSKSDDPDATTCDETEELDAPITIRSDADFANLPDGCWDLFARLRLEGPGVTSLAKLGSLEAVNELEIVDTGLTTIDTKLPLKVWGSLTVSGNAKLTSLANLPLENASNLTAAYTVRGNPALTTLGGIEYMQTVDGDLRISDNAALASITLDELTAVGGSVVISNTGATRIDLGSLQTVSRLEIASNPRLATFDGLDATVISGDLVLRGNPALTSLGTVASVGRIEGTLTIDDNDALANLDALSGLQLITGALVVTNNSALGGLGRLSHLSGIGATVTITGNANLTYCAAHEVDHCVSSGAATIANNKTTTGTNCPCWCQP